MHLLMMFLYAAATAIVFGAIDSKPETLRERFIHGLKVFAWFIGVGLLISLVLFPVPW